MRRIGKKAMSIYRTSVLLEKKLATRAPGRIARLVHWRPTRRQYVIAAVILMVGFIASAGYLYWSGEQDKVRRAAEQVQIERERQASIKSNECRKQKLAAKADQLGKITYDELYDYTVCDYSGQ
jgi:hypothetical protein